MHYFLSMEKESEGHLFDGTHLKQLQSQVFLFEEYAESLHVCGVFCREVVEIQLQSWF